MHRSLPFTVLIIIAALVIALVWVSNRLNRIPTPEPVASEVKPPPPAEPTASQHLLVGYGDPAAEPTEDLRKLHRVTTGYFSVIKDPGRFPIGGNADLAAALRGENPNREVFLPHGHPAFSDAGLLIDRWGTPLVVHPVAWGQLELRSAGPDRVPHTADDLVLSPAGTRVEEP